MHAMMTDHPPAHKAQAIILAAGRGERMRPLTDSCPKPLLPVRGQSLIARHVQALVSAGFARQLINTAWLGEQIEATLRTGKALGADLRYSHEGQDFGRALETAGGIARALPRLEAVFWVLAGDVFVPGFEFSRAAFERFASSNKQAHLWFVPNPAHNAAGDFGLSAEGLALNLPQGSPRWTYSTIGLYRSSFFATLPCGNAQGLSAPLAPLLRAAMDGGRVSAEMYRGEWTDVGTPERLAQLSSF
jgi:N-acetyl-alpha-D-muramate 1-phosphate uridylyltransferase